MVNYHRSYQYFSTSIAALRQVGSWSFHYWRCSGSPVSVSPGNLELDLKKFNATVGEAHHLLHLWGQGGLPAALAGGGRALPGVGGETPDGAVGADHLFWEGHSGCSARAGSGSRWGARGCRWATTPWEGRTTLSSLNRNHNLVNIFTIIMVSSSTRLSPNYCENACW